MIILYVLLALIILAALILLLKIKIVIDYHEKLKFCFYIGFIKISPAKFNKKASKNKSAKKTDSKTKKPKKQEDSSKGIDKKDIIKLIKELVRELITKFLHYLKIEKYDIKVTVASPDAASTAIIYGAASAALYDLTSILHTLKKAKRGTYSAAVIPDFASGSFSGMNVEAELAFSVRIWQAAVCAIKGGGIFLNIIPEKARIQIKKQQKKIDKA